MELYRVSHTSTVLFEQHFHGRPNTIGNIRMGYINGHCNQEKSYLYSLPILEDYQELAPMSEKFWIKSQFKMALKCTQYFIVQIPTWI